MKCTDIMIKDDFLSIEKYKNVDTSDIKSIAFTGSPRQHPSDNEKFILILNPLSDNTEFIEFNKNDIVYIEDLPTISTQSKGSVSMKIIWMKEGAVAVKMTPFVIAKTSTIYD